MKLHTIYRVANSKEKKDKFSQDDEDCPIQSGLHYFILSTHGKHQDSRLQAENLKDMIHILCFVHGCKLYIDEHLTLFVHYHRREPYHKFVQVQLRLNSDFFHSISCSPFFVE
jgi:hypothetical protein